MATCKDCLHNNICNIKQRYNHPKYALQHIEKYCEHFKDRSRFVELPCKVGDTVYILGKEIFCDEIDEISIEKLSDGILCFRAYCKELKFSLDLKDFGTIAFLTREEAEQALAKQNQPDNTPQ